MNIVKILLDEEEFLQRHMFEEDRAVVVESLGRIEDAVMKRIRQLEGAIEDIATYATIETNPMVLEIINGVLNKEEK